jgi:hypothetical protein
MDIPQKLRDLAVSDTGFLFDPYTGSTFSANETGLAVLAGLRAGRSRAEILAALKDAFELGPGSDPERDLDDFLLTLRRNDLIPEGFQP